MQKNTKPMNLNYMKRSDMSLKVYFDERNCPNESLEYVWIEIDIAVHCTWREIAAISHREPYIICNSTVIKE